MNAPEEAMRNSPMSGYGWSCTLSTLLALNAACPAVAQDGAGAVTPPGSTAAPAMQFFGKELDAAQQARLNPKSLERMSDLIHQAEKRMADWNLVFGADFRKLQEDKSLGRPVDENRLRQLKEARDNIGAELDHAVSHVLSVSEATEYRRVLGALQAGKPTAPTPQTQPAERATPSSDNTARQAVSQLKLPTEIDRNVGRLIDDHEKLLASRTKQLNDARKLFESGRAEDLAQARAELKLLARSRPPTAYDLDNKIVDALPANQRARYLELRPAAAARPSSNSPLDSVPDRELDGAVAVLVKLPDLALSKPSGAGRAGTLLDGLAQALDATGLSRERRAELLQAGVGPSGPMVELSEGQSRDLLWEMEKFRAEIEIQTVDRARRRVLRGRFNDLIAPLDPAHRAWLAARPPVPADAPKPKAP